MRSNLATASFLLCVICAFAFTGIDSSQGATPKNWDILGVKIGMSIENATSALKTHTSEVKIKLIKHAIRDYGFTSPEYLFGAIYSTHDGNIQLALDHNGRIIGVSRSFVYKDKIYAMSGIRIESLYKALTDKYGLKPYKRTEQYGLKQDKNDVFTSSPVYYFWSTKTVGDTFYDDFIRGPWKGLHLAFYDEEPNNYKDYLKGHNDPGIILAYKISFDNDHFVKSIDCVMIDVSNMNSSYEYIHNIVANGVAERKKEIKEVKPKL